MDEEKARELAQETEQAEKDVRIEDDIVYHIEEARRLCQEHDVDWLEMLERSGI